MFRRREDSLFDNATDPNQFEQEGTETSANAQPAPSAQSFSSPSASFNSAPASQPAPRNAALPENRPAPQPASSFRPAPSAQASATGDLSRNRMPESKQAASSFNNAAVNPASSFMPPMDKTKGGPKRILTVGNDILLKGEIATCDRLVIEGKVDATLNDVHTVEIAEHGSFKGSAHIEDAEISGLFEGDLVVRNRLVIYATGKVRGNITYGEIEIERGGELTGEIRTTTTQSAVTPRRANKDEKVAA